MSSGGPSEFTEEQVEELAEKVLSAVKKKMIDELSTSFYDELSGYLYEHYDNHRQRIEEEVVSKMADQFAQKPEEYKFQALRQRMFEENRPELERVLTDEAIAKNVERVLFDRTAGSEYFAWKWKDGIARFVREHWSLFKNEDRIQSDFVRAWEREVYKNRKLQERLAEIGEEANR